VGAAIASLVRACALLCACAACGGDRGSVADASAGLQRHRAAFVAFDRWVRLAMQGADLFKDERALAEALFSKARADRSIVGAWVEQSGKPMVAIALPEAASPPVMSVAQRVRDTELGTLEVLLAAACPERARRARAAAPAAAATAQRRCLIVARSAPGPRGTLRVVAAFED